MVRVAGPEQRDRGAEDLFFQHGHARPDMIEHGRLVIEAGPGGCPAAGEDLRALVHRVADLPDDRITQVGPGERPDRHSLLGGIPEPEFPDTGRVAAR